MIDTDAIRKRIEELKADPNVSARELAFTGIRLMCEIVDELRRQGQASAPQVIHASAQAFDEAVEAAREVQMDAAMGHIAQQAIRESLAAGARPLRYERPMSREELAKLTGDDEGLL